MSRPATVSVSFDRKGFTYSLNIPKEFASDLQKYHTYGAKVAAHVLFVWKQARNLPHNERVMVTRKVIAMHKPEASDDAVSMALSRFLRKQGIVTRNRKSHAESRPRTPKVAAPKGFKVAKAYWLGMRYVVMFEAK